MPLAPPLLLQANTTYYLASVVGPSDQWPDAYTPASWNAWFVGSTAGSTRVAQYGPGYAAGLTPVWPPPYMSPNGNNNTYGNVMLGYIEVDQARVGVAQTSVTIPQGQTLNVGGFASGQRPVTYQWYEVGVGAVAKQTNATLVISNVPISASGTYYLTATNALGGEQSANVTVSVTSIPVGIMQNPTNVTAFHLLSVAAQRRPHPRSHERHLFNAGQFGGQRRGVFVPGVQLPQFGAAHRDEQQRHADCRG